MNDFFFSLPLDRWRAFAEGRPVVRCSPGHLIYLQDTERSEEHTLNSSHQD